MDLKVEDLILNSSKMPQPPNLAGSAAKDIALLGYALEKGYVGFKFLNSGLRRQTFDQLSDLATHSDFLSPSDLCNQLGRILTQIPDSHLQVQFGNRGCPLVGNQTRKASVGQNYGTKHSLKGDLPWAVSSIQVDAQAIPVVSLFRFPPPNHPGWNGFDSAFEASLSAPAMIIDLRGNGGGDDTKAFEIAKRLIGEKFQTPQEEKKTRVTPAARAIFLNKTLFEIERYKKSGDPVPAFLIEEERLRRAAFEKSETQIAQSEFETYPFPIKPSSHSRETYDKPIAVLIDADCGSTGELLAIALKNSSNVTVFGENSAGFLHFGNPGLLVLPYSKIMVEIPTTFKNFRKIEWLEKVGITPDIAVPSGKDAIESAREILRTKNPRF